MGQGIDLARAGAPIHAAVLDELKEQLLVAMVKKYGPVVKLTVEEVDATGDSVLLMSVNPVTKEFTFEARKKQ